MMVVRGIQLAASVEVMEVPGEELSSYQLDSAL